MKTIILLTGCVNPNGMAYTSLNDTTERERQYINAIRYYLTHTSYPVVFTENSGTDISHHFKKQIESNRLECLTFQGNQKKDKGKGYGECEIIEYTINNSHFLLSHTPFYIVKITGRLIVQNIASLVKLHQTFSSKRTTFCMINSDLTFPDSRVILAHVDFYKDFINYKEQIDDTLGYFFEHALWNLIKNNRSFSFSPFFIQPQIIGISGSTGVEYTVNPMSISFIYKYARFALSQLRSFNKLYRKP